MDDFSEIFIKPMNVHSLYILALLCSLWGLWVGSPFWEVTDSEQVFSFLVSVAPEWMFGGVAVTIGVALFACIGLNRISCIKYLTAAAFYFWFAVSMCFFVGDWQNTGGVTNSAIALYCGYAALNLSVNKKYFENNIKVTIK